MFNPARRSRCGADSVNIPGVCSRALVGETEASKIDMVAFKIHFDRLEKLCTFTIFWPIQSSLDTTCGKVKKKVDKQNTKERNHSCPGTEKER